MQFNRDADGALTPAAQALGGYRHGPGAPRRGHAGRAHATTRSTCSRHLIEAAARRHRARPTWSSNSLRVIADHIRSCAFLIVDGVIPGNEGRGYVLRRIIRRAIRHGYKLGAERAVLLQAGRRPGRADGRCLSGTALRRKAQVARILRQEEERFAETLEQGMRILDDSIAALAGKTIPGEVVFKLYDTYGFPADLTADIARERELQIDLDGFERQMQAQRERARAASQFGAGQSTEVRLEGETEFTGYERLDGDATVVALFADGESAETLAAGQAGMVVLDRTPFYAESGGQVGDAGMLAVVGGDARFSVADTRKQGGKVFGHVGKVAAGEVRVGDTVSAGVDARRRRAIALNHSATHLMHAALRQVLGEHVQQKGSLVDADRLRFDFSHFQPLTGEEIAAIERLVNEQIRRNDLVETRIMALNDARASGAMALFGEKYDDQVRVLRMGDFSVELCGGTHVKATGDIGLFKIVLETGIASGIRRIEAVTGEAAVQWVAHTEQKLGRVMDLLGVGREEIDDKLVKVLERQRKLEKEIEQLSGKLASAAGADLIDQAIEINGTKVLAAKLDGVEPKALRDTMDQMKSKLGSAVIVLATVNGNKVSLIAGVTKDRTDKIKAGDLIRVVAEKVGGKGGGRPDMAQAGGSNPAGLPEALALVESIAREQL